MLTHKEKLHLARMPGMQTKEERSKKNRIQAVGHGMMVSRHFSTAGWSAHKHSIENRIKKSLGTYVKKEEIKEEKTLDKPLVEE